MLKIPGGKQPKWKTRKISQESARRWLKRNNWNLAKFRLGFFSGKSKFAKQLAVCLRSLK